MSGLKRYRSFVADSARWKGFAFRPGDIAISTPPKCGTTWTQMLCALLAFDTADLPRPLAEISPWLDMQTRSLDSVVADLQAQTHRRFIKTHTPLDGRGVTTGPSSGPVRAGNGATCSTPTTSIPTAAGWPSSPRRTWPNGCTPAGSPAPPPPTTDRRRALADGDVGSSCQ
jgi:hypothetical protein